MTTGLRSDARSVARWRREGFVFAVLASLLLFGFASPIAAQRPDSTRRDSTARADSARLADSLLIIREIERIRGEPRVMPDTNPPRATGSGPTNPRLLPDISAVGDLIADLSDDGSTQEDGTRFGIREVEVALQAAVDPYFRGDVFIGFSDAEGVAIEQAYLTASALPFALEARLGRYLMPFGKQNTTHRHDLHTIEYPHVLQRYLGPEGLKGTGISVSRIFAPLGFYQELLIGVNDRFGEAPEDLSTIRPVNRRLSGLAYDARLRNYWDLSQASNLEISGSALTGRREQPIEGPSSFAAVARQSLLGVDVTFRWRPLQQGLYKSFIVQAEFLRQINERGPELPPVDEDAPAGAIVSYAGPLRDFSGGYVFARWQLTRRAYIGARFDAVQDHEFDGETLYAGSGYLQWFPSEFSKILAGIERVSPPGALDAVNRVILQATFAIGPHKPHPF